MTAAPPDGVRVHLHFTMTGRYPLRLVDLLFCETRVLAVEYGYVTPVDLLTGGPARRADTFAATVREDGTATAVDDAERVEEFTYTALSAVRVHDGGRFGRPKVELRRADDIALGVRVHGEFDSEAFVTAVETVVSGTGTDIERERGTGLGLFDRLPVSRSG